MRPVVGARAYSDDRHFVKCQIQQFFVTISGIILVLAFFP
jgi:hypothetical protein